MPETTCVSNEVSLQPDGATELATMSEVDKEKGRSEDTTQHTSEEGRDVPLVLETTLDGFWYRQAKRMARNPWLHLGISLAVSVTMSVLAMTVGGFETTVDNAGWQSRGTLIANRQTQLMLIQTNQEYLFYEGPEAWEDLLTNVQPGWETGEQWEHDAPSAPGARDDRRLQYRITPRVLE
jgi:hypothetical protein